jgi:hypothetical protein
VLSVRALWIVVPLIAACSGEPREPGGHDAGADSDSDVGTTPCAPISGTGPFGVVVSGSGPVTKVSSRGDAAVTTVSASATLYFPRGRVAGGEVVITGGRVKHALLDDTLSAAVSSGWECSSSLVGNLIGPTDGIDAMLSIVTTGNSDAIGSVSGRLKMCAAGAPPSQTLSPKNASSIPAVQRSFSIDGTRPFAAESFATIRADSGAPLKITETPTGMVVEATDGTFPLFAPTIIDLSGVRDVLGEPLGLTSVRTTVPTEAITDLGFATTPPKGSYVGGLLEVQPGTLVLGNFEENTAVALAIGNVAGKTKLRVRHFLSCPEARPRPWTVNIVSADGRTTPLAPKCGTAMVDETIALAGTGPFVLHAVTTTLIQPPCSYPFGQSETAYVIDEIAFE